MSGHIFHPIDPFFDRESRILILGSFPSVKSREAGFFYGHPRNRFWQLTAGILGEQVPATVEEKKRFLARNHIALWDVIAECDITGSSDASIRNARPTDLSRILDHAPVERIFLNGQTAAGLFEKFQKSNCTVPAVKLPSTSPANAAWSLEKLKEAWKIIRLPLNPLLSRRACRLCPRNCGVDRFRTSGFCRSGISARAARAALHPWEEPCVSGKNGSGTVFFSGCTLRCCFCQNYSISQENFGKDIDSRRLSRIFLELQEKGAHNINLVTGTHFLPEILEALELAKPGLNIPVVYNCGGYEKEEIIELLHPYVDIWLPDLKYDSPELSGKYSSAPDYFSFAFRAVKKMIELSGPPVYFPSREGETPLLRSGVIIRHMVLPGHRDDSIRLLNRMAEELPRGSFLLSLLSQYTPFYHSADYPEINRRITSYEYDKVVEEAVRLSLTEGFMQEKSSAKEEYTPPFELQGI